MSRLARVEYEGAIYHVTVRGNNRRELFRDDRDRVRFLRRLKEGAEECGIRVYAFCLMPNHVHLVVETPQANLGVFMHKVVTAYTVYYNRRHRQSGHVTQGRYGAKAVEGDAYLLALARYVHVNPVYVGDWPRQPFGERVRALRAYGWSSYGSYLGKKSWGFVQTGPLLAMMHGRGDRRRRVEFRRFVEAGLAESDTEFLRVYKGSRLGIGGTEFLDALADRYEEAVRRGRKVEDVALRRVGRRLDGARIVEVACRHMGVVAGSERVRRRGNWVRAVVARMLVRHGGLTQREAAGVLGIGTGKSVSDQLQRLNAALGADRSLRQRVHGLEQELEAGRSCLKH
jgi:REP element-mobilizing transposase RayT